MELLLFIAIIVGFIFLFMPAIIGKLKSSNKASIQENNSRSSIPATEVHNLDKKTNESPIQKEFADIESL